MFPRKPLFHWQEFAQGLCAAKSGFASTRNSLHHGVIGGSRRCGTAFHCDPFPSIWPGLFGAGPFFARPAVAQGNRRSLADGTAPHGSADGNFPFVQTGLALESGCITTNIRGISCGNSSHFSSLQPRLQAACKTPARARRQVPLRARWSRTQPKATSSMALSSVAWPALRPAPFRARSAADETTLTAAAAGLSLIPATHGAIPVGGFFISRPMAALT